MRGRLIVFMLVFAVLGIIVSWTIGHDPRLFIGGVPGSSQLASVPARGGFNFPREIRVSLLDSPVSQVQMTVDQPYSARQPGAAHGGPGSGAQGTMTVRITPNGFRIGQREYRGAAVEIDPNLSPAIWIEGHEYRGRMRFVRQAADKMLVVNVVGLEDYIASVVDGEMPATFPDAARQAQAIAARTYALFQMQAAAPRSLFDVSASTRSQNYLGFQYRGGDGRLYAAETASGRRMAEETAGMVCLSHGKLFPAYYTAVCGGQTASGGDVFNDPSPALVSVSCDGCQDAAFYRWTREIPLDRASDVLQRNLASRGKRFDSLVSIRHISRTLNVREASFELSDGTHRYRFTATDLRRLFPASILSFQFEARIGGGQKGQELEFEGRGHGHGVGLCQWGARGMALSGSGPLDILRHYYTGAEIVAAR